MKRIVPFLVAVLISTTASAGEWAYRVSPVRTAMLTKPTAKEGAAVGAHWAYLKEQFRNGTIVFAGRTTSMDKSTFGIVVFRADDEQAARAVMNADPSVKQGVFKASLYPFSVALLEGRPAPE